MGMESNTGNMDILAVNSAEDCPTALPWGGVESLAKLLAAVDGVLDRLRPKVVTDNLVVYCLQKIVGARLKYMWTGHYLAPKVLAKLTAKCRRLLKQKAVEAYLVDTQNWLGLPHGVLQHPQGGFENLATQTGRWILGFVARMAEAGWSLDPVLNEWGLGWGHVDGGSIPLATVLDRAEYRKARKGMAAAG
ncbi:hypothetical protein HK101_005427 [Irineochytrium annulatum]|nr:hypothetical protein HK101_005427 [Irineochytrium annulatum]